MTFTIEKNDHDATSLSEDAGAVVCPHRRLLVLGARGVRAVEGPPRGEAL